MFGVADVDVIDPGDELLNGLFVQVGLDQQPTHGIGDPSRETWEGTERAVERYVEIRVAEDIVRTISAAFPG
ncbi:hypothetical protein [Nocardioides currus]|uniref:hypothetical protein n=1 Tax=Nocardioides currus TaxID=2133958 RepID=UPI001FAED38E|nr:hypothetical protein [Nocardioides currus]